MGVRGTEKLQSFQVRPAPATRAPRRVPDCSHRVGRPYRCINKCYAKCEVSMKGNGKGAPKIKCEWNEGISMCDTAEEDDYE